MGGEGMSAKKRNEIDDPLNRAATLGIIGGGKTVKPVSATPTIQVQTTGKEEREAKEKRTRKGQYVYLPPDLIRYLKYQAADRELEISEVVEETIREHRDRHQE